MDARKTLPISLGLVLALFVGLLLFLVVDEEQRRIDCGLADTALAAVHVDPTSVPQGPIAGYEHEQLVNAAHIMLAARDKRLSLRDQQIGVMTAMGESSLRVLDHGDSAGPDSRGLFQQRTSWGSLADRMDPYKSAVLFFNAMVQVENRINLEPTIVAHRTQRNADPYHYRRYWGPAGEVVSALGNIRPAAATIPAASTTSSQYDLGPVQPQLTALVNVLGPMFSIKTVGGWRPSATDPNGHPAGLAADFMVPMTRTGKAQGDGLAAYAKLHAAQLKVDYIIWRQRIWSISRAAEGWRPMEDRGSPTANHMDHVHINVLPSGSPSTTPIAATGDTTDCELLPVGYGGTFIAPIDAEVTSPYGPRTNPYTGQPSFHDGVDYGASCGRDFKASGTGLVVKAATDPIYGHQIIIDHGSGIKTRYGHMFASGVLVGVGDQVETGTVIGRVGKDGWSTGCHLHFTVEVDGQHTDPIAFLANPPVTASGDGYYTVTRKRPSGSMYHSGWCCSAQGLSQYHKANSARGIRYAANHGYKQIDLDMMTTKDGVIVVTHSFGAMAKEDFRDPDGILRNRTIDSMTWEQVSRLRRPDGYRIHALAELLPLLNRYGLIGALELKGDGREGYRIISEAKIGEIATLANAARAHVFIKADPAKGRLIDGLEMAQRRGFWTRKTGTGTFMPPANLGRDQ